MALRLIRVITEIIKRLPINLVIANTLYTKHRDPANTYFNDDSDAARSIRMEY